MAYSDIEAFCAAYGPSLCPAVLSNEERSITSSRAPRVINLCAYGDNAPRAWLEAQISAANLEFEKRMTPYAISSLAAALLADFGGLRVTEVLLFFAKLRAGHYGKFYGAVDGIDIAAKFQAFSKWLSRRRSEIMVEAERELKKKEDEAHASRSVSREVFERMVSAGFDPSACRLCSTRDCMMCIEKYK